MVNVDVTLYAITDRGAIGQRDFYEAIEAALKGGATILQLREKGLDEVSLIEEAKKVKSSHTKGESSFFLAEKYHCGEYRQ